MHATESYDLKSGSRSVPRSPAAAAQLLELWVQGRVILDRTTVDESLFLLRQLDSRIAYKYDAVYVTEV